MSLANTTSLTFWDTTYYKTFNLEAVDFSTWYEVNKMNAEKPKKTILYSTYSMTDGFEGSFFNEPWSSNVKYRFKIDSLKVSDIYSLAGKLGQRHANYLYDFFLNQYIRFILPKNRNHCITTITTTNTKAFSPSKMTCSR